MDAFTWWYLGIGCVIGPVTAYLFARSEDDEPEAFAVGAILIASVLFWVLIVFGCLVVLAGKTITTAARR